MCIYFNEYFKKGYKQKIVLNVFRFVKMLSKYLKIGCKQKIVANILRFVRMFSYS